MVKILNGSDTIDIDNGSDSFPVLQQLVDGISGGIIELRGSNETIMASQPIVIPNNKNIEICGSGFPTVKLLGGNSIFRFTSAGPMHGKTTRISGLVLDASNLPNSHAIDTDSVGGNVDFDNLIVSDCRVIGTTGYDIYLPNLDYSIAPKFRDLRGVHGIYIAGSVHTTSNLEISGCRWHNQHQIGPLINLWGCRKFILRDNITEGGADFAAGVDPNADDVQNTVGILIRNPGPRGGEISNNWFEFWGQYSNPSVKHLTIDYTFNTGGAQQCSRYKITNTNCTRVAFKNLSTTDPLEIDLEPNELYLPDTTDSNVFDVRGRTVVYISGRVQKSDKPRNKAVRLSKSMSIGAAYRAFHYEDTPTEVYTYSGGTGIYRADALAGTWTDCRPFVQHHPQFGHSIVWKAITKLQMNGHGTFRIPVQAGQELYQRMLIASPHLLATTGQSEVALNNQNMSIHGLCRNFGSFIDGHSPRLIEAVGDASQQSFPISNLHPQAKWVQLFAGNAAAGAFDRLPAVPYNFNCFEWPNDPGPPKGTVIVGDVCKSIDGQSVWKCTKAGTSRPIAIEADCIQWSATIQNINEITELLVGDYLHANSVEYRILAIGSGSVTLDKGMRQAGRIAFTNAAPIWTQL